MIAAAYESGNNNAEFIFYELFGGNNVVQDYSVIESEIHYRHIIDYGRCKLIKSVFGLAKGCNNDLLKQEHSERINYNIQIRKYRTRTTLISHPFHSKEPLFQGPLLLPRQYSRALWFQAFL